MKKIIGAGGSLGKIVVVLIIVGGAAIVAYNAFRGNSPQGGSIVEPAALSTLANAGNVLFDAKCAGCHGLQGKGTNLGPPFVNDIYNPGHHPDEAFFYAARNGVRSHHWRFGNMPPVAGVTDAEVAAIVKYVREIQEANGIRFRPHVM